MNEHEATIIDVTKQDISSECSPEEQCSPCEPNDY